MSGIYDGYGDNDIDDREQELQQREYDLSVRERALNEKLGVIEAQTEESRQDAWRLCAAEIEAHPEWRGEDVLRLYQRHGLAEKGWNH